MQIDLRQLEGKTVYLDMLRTEHFAGLKNLAKDERIWEFTKTVLVNDQYETDIENYLSTALDAHANGGQQAFVIRQRSDDAMIGMTRMYAIDQRNKRLTIGATWYTPKVWGQVHNKECKLLLLQYVFEIWGFNRVDFYIAAQNLRSQKAVQKIGAVREGVLRSYAQRPDGSIVDSVVFSIIRDEWPEKKTELKRLIEITGSMQRR